MGSGLFSRIVSHPPDSGGAAGGGLSGPAESRHSKIVDAGADPARGESLAADRRRKRAPAQAQGLVRLSGVGGNGGADPLARSLRTFRREGAMSSRGFVYVATGEPYRREAAESAASLRATNPGERI